MQLGPSSWAQAKFARALTKKKNRSIIGKQT